MRRKIKIGIFTHNYPTNSRERKDAGIFIYDFVHELSKHLDVYVLCPDFSGKKENYKKVPVTWFKWDGGKEKFGEWKILSPLSIFKFGRLISRGSRESLKFVKKNKIDVVLACWALPSGVFARYVKKQTGIPYAVWSLGSDINKYARYPFLRNLIKGSLVDADLRFANSFALVGDVESISRKTCEFLPAITNFKSGKVLPKQLDKNKTNFLFVGRLEKVKGPDILLEAIKVIKRKKDNLALNILGDGSLTSQLKDTIRKEGLKDSVNLLGWADKDEVSSYMKASDCLIIPSRSESFPLVMIEAARIGLPVIATNVGDCKKTITKYKIGYIVKKEDPGSLARAMFRAIKEGNNFKRSFSGNLKKFADIFSQTKTKDKFLNSLLHLSNI